MFSIKKSFANCSVCPLLPNYSCILETNCEKDLSKVDVVFVAENPGKDEVKKGFPLVGRAGQLFRKYFNQYGVNKLNYLLTNIVLCQTLNPDGTTGNPDPKVIDICKDNCFNIIDTCKPKIIVLMGASPLSAFGIAKSGITNLHGNLVEWNGYKTFIMVHPSFVNRNKNVWTSKFRDAMAEVYQLASGKKITVQTESHGKTLKQGIYRYQIPEKFYTPDYRLVDIQYLNKTHKVLYIFRDMENQKVYHKESDDFICYQIRDGYEARKIVPYDHLNQVSIKYKDRYNLDPEITYEGDVRITSKHAMDYYHFSQGEANRTYDNVMYFDIEVDTGDERVFPAPKQARFPINMMTTIYNGHKIFYGVDNKTEPIKQIEGVEFKIFNDEKSMMQQFINDFKETDPDFIAGWNLINFDMDYIFNRLPKIGIDATSLSKFGEFFVEGDKYYCHLIGSVALDQEFLYRTFTFTKMENYKLGFIAQHELGVTKLQLPLPFNEMYWKMLNTTIEYNIRDTELLEKLEEKLAHINLLNELRIICNTSFDAVSSFGQIDSLMVSYLRNKGVASKNADPHIVKQPYPGAFVFDPTPGAYDWITDFDFASLYPSLMITYNIGVNTFVLKTKDPHLGYEIAYRPDSLPKKIKVILDPLYKKEEVEITPEQLFNKIKEFDLVHTINGCFFQPHEKEFSVFGEVVDMLMKSRKNYKKQMFTAIETKDVDQEKFFYTRQLVYKVLANTLYGVIANKSFRFFDTSQAAAITLSGQEALKTSIIYGDEYVRSLTSEKEYKEPVPLSKKEMFSDEMPERSNEYIITGDTDSIFCCFEKAKGEITVQKILEWCAGIETFLNDNKIIECVKRHNVDLEFNRLTLKNELVISRGLFLAKKRYAIRVINNEGKDVDKINYMGLEIKRSDYPSKSKEFLSELTELILKSEKFKISKLLSFVERKEKEFKDLILAGDKSIARPISWGKKIEDYKTIPQGVRAMQTWNHLMYNIHNVGNKAYMFWIRGIDFDGIPDDEERERLRKKYSSFVSNGHKLEVIGLPDEEEKLPSYFIPDVNAAMKFSFIDRYELMLKPLLEVKKQSELLTI